MTAPSPRDAPATPGWADQRVDKPPSAPARERTPDQVVHRARVAVAGVRVLMGMGSELTFGARQIAADGILTGILPNFTRQRPGLGLNLLVGQWRSMREHLAQERIELFVGYSCIDTCRSDLQITRL